MLMRKLTPFVTAAILVAAALTVHGWAQESLKGEWQGRFESGGAERGTFYLEVRTSDWRHNHSWGETHKADEFSGLDANLAAKDGPAHFELRREAGTLAFDGTFRGGKGTAAFHSNTPAEFIRKRKGKGYTGLSIE